MLAQTGTKRSSAGPESGDREVGFGEIGARAEQELARELGGGVAQAVTEVQASAVTAFAVSAVGVGRRLPVCISEGYDRDLGFHDKECQKTLSLHPEAGRQDEARLGQRRRANPRGW